MAELAVELQGGAKPISFRRQIVARYIPILPMVFFGPNDSTLNPMYQSTGDFDEQRLPTDAERAHARTLDVFGQRLSRSPRARVTITGTTSSDEVSRSDLAASRARAAASYLMTRWGIDKARIILKSQLDPDNPSNPANREGLEENRRVELEFTDDDIYRPVQLRTIEPVTDPPSIIFRAQAESRSTIQRWELEVRGDKGNIRTLTGDGRPPSTIEWTLTNDDRESVMKSRETMYRLAVFDSIDRMVAIERTVLPVRLDTTVSVTSRDRQPDARADFLLVTFDFDRAQLTRRGREELRTILGRIGSQSRVEVIGYTDPIGDAEHNQGLALARARNVATQIPGDVLSTYRGATPDEAPYTSKSAAGRFLSRTVRVVVENPN